MPAHNHPHYLPSPWHALLCAWLISSGVMDVAARSSAITLKAEQLFESSALSCEGEGPA